MDKNWKKSISVLLGAFLITFLFGRITVAAADLMSPNDPMRAKQTYLDQIHVPEAWPLVPSGSAPMIVALVDTGVDLTHPDLQGKLVAGVNLLDPKSPPQDDNGHGTNVAGIIAAASNNDKGIAGIASNVRIMPIKALKDDGTGDEAKLSEGIRYAVDHNAKIIVLSLGLNKYNEELAQTVQYAEERGVLLVAATGNEGTTVKYPAAYPTVLGVGGVTAGNQAEYRSNSGPEVDLVAPYDVFTTALGGGYEYKNGTSMSAPQVAAVAALGWSKYPTFKPYQIRNLLRQTAEDLETPGWDPYTGFGLVRADNVLNQPYREDAFEPNDRASDATKVPVNRMLNGEFANGQDQDWFQFEVPYTGTLYMTFQTSDGAPVKLTMYDANMRQQGTYTPEPNNAIQAPVDRGIAYARLQALDGGRKSSQSYRMTTDLHIYADPFEPNDKQYQAFELPAQSQIIRGTFDHANDVDWYMMHIEQSGRLSLRLSTDTARIDPVLLVEKKGEKAVTYDEANSGEDETASFAVFPGDYYFRVTNLNNGSPILGEYSLSFNYTAKWIDPNEPNDKPYEATSMAPGSEYIGTFDPQGDIDWFQLIVPQDSLAEISLSGIPPERTVTATLTDSTLTPVWSGASETGPVEAKLAREQYLTSGTYYIKLQSDLAFSDRPYRLQADLLPLIAGYADIADHWAQSAIVEMTRRELIEGYGNYRFMPESLITRAEAATILAKAFRYSKENPLRFTDLPASHWAYDYIAKAAQAGIIEGYPDHTFAPDAPITRMEMASMAAKALGLAGKKRGNAPFADVGEDDWGTGILKQMKADGWISGFPDGTFRPERQATRAEFVSLLQKILNR